MNKKGFTLVELIAIIGLLSVIIIIAVPSIISIRKSILEREDTSQINSIESAAVYYAQDNNISLDCISIETLLSAKYLEPTYQNGSGNCTKTNGCLLRPSDNVDINNNCVKIVKSGHKITATYYNKNNCD